MTCPVCVVSLSAVMDKAEYEAGGFCDVCKMAVRYVDGILEQNATEAQIEEAVKKVCNFLPDEFKTQVCSLFFFSADKTVCARLPVDDSI